MSSTEYESEFLNNVRIVGSVTNPNDVNNASLQTNSFGVSGKAVMNNVDISTNASVGGTMNVVGASTLANTTMDSATVTNNEIIGGTLKVTGVSTLAAVTMDSSTITNNVSVGGSATIGGNFAVTGNTTLNGTTTVGSIRPFSSNVNIGNSTTLSESNTGQVLIGDYATSTGSSSVGIGLQSNVKFNGVAIGKEAVSGNGGVSVGYRSSSGSNSNTILIGSDNFSSGGNNADIIGVGRTNNQPNSLLLGTGSYTNIRANNTCDLGTTAISFKSLYSNGSIVGTTNSRLTNDIVSNLGDGVTGNILSFADGSGKIITNSGIIASTLTGGPFLGLTGGTMNVGAVINYNTGTITNLSTINNKIANDLVTSAAIGAINTVPTYDGTKGIQTTGVLFSDLATNTGLTAGLALKVSKSGDTMSGNLAMGTYNITEIGSIAGSVKTSDVNSIVTGSAGAAADNLCAFNGTSGNIVKDTGIPAYNVVTGPATAVNNNIAAFNLATGKIIKDAGISTTNVFKVDGTVPMIGIFSQSNTTDSTTATSGSIVNQGGIGVGKALSVGTNLKVFGTVDSTTTTSGSLQTLGGIGVAKQATIGGLVRVIQSSGATNSTDGSINTLGGLSTAKNIIVGDTTDSTSSTTGSLITAGGLGVAKKAYVGTQLSVGTTSNIANLVVSGGVTNVGSEQSCIRAISSSQCAKIEIQNTATSGHLFELRSSADGNFDITDRTTGATRFTIISGRTNFGFNVVPPVSGDGNIYVGNGVLPGFPPTNGGCLCTQSGNLYWYSQGGKLTLLASNT